MRKVIFPLAFVATSSLVACSFQMRAGTGAQSPNNSQPQNSGQTAAQTAPTTPANTPPPVNYKGPAIRKLGKRASGSTGPTPTPSSSQTTPAPTPSTPTGAAVVNAPTVFGNGTTDPAGFKGNIYFIPAGATKVPALASLTPNGYLFTKEINVAPQAFSTGFPGVDATKKENFAIRYEAPVIVNEELDYDFRIVSDDGAVLLIDGTEIVNNGEARTAPAEKSGPVHLRPGTHILTIDYLQTTGNVALQVYCKKANDTEKLCTPAL
jgi:hypothetical protein